MPEPTRPSDYRVLFSNAFGLRVFGNRDVTLMFGVDMDPENTGEHILEQVGIALNLSSMKLLAKMLTDAVTQIEQASGEEVPLAKEKVEALDKALKGAVKKRTESGPQ